MIQLLATESGKLYISRFGNYECKPWGINTQGETVIITSLIDKESLYTGHFSEFTLEDEPFGDLFSLIDFISPYLGFSTTSGGSGVTPPLPNENAQLIRTGVNMSFAVGDDGYLQLGRGSGILDMSIPNFFGNQNRLTDLSGGQDYLDGIMLDHSTFNGEKLLGYMMVPIEPAILTDQFAKIKTNYVGWRMTNIRELENLVHFGFDKVLNYSPLNLLTENIFSSTPFTGDYNQVWILQSEGYIVPRPKLDAYSVILCRDYEKSALGF